MSFSKISSASICHISKHKKNTCPATFVSTRKGTWNLKHAPLEKDEFLFLRFYSFNFKAVHWHEPPFENHDSFFYITCFICFLKSQLIHLHCNCEFLGTKNRPPPPPEKKRMDRLPQKIIVFSAQGSKPP